jgi:hypothetical protein
MQNPFLKQACITAQISWYIWIFQIAGIRSDNITIAAKEYRLQNGRL